MHQQTILTAAALPLHRRASPSTSTNIVCTSPVVVNQASTCTATVTEQPTTASSMFTINGTVSFSQTGVNAIFTGSPCKLVPGTSAGTASCSVTLSASSAGFSAVIGTYSGDNAHSGSNANSPVTINTRSTFTSVTCDSSVAIGQAAKCTVTVTDISTAGTPLTPTGTVTFTLTGSGSLSAQSCLLSSGSCTFSFTGASSETATLTGAYTPDSTHSSSTSPVATVNVHCNCIRYIAGVRYHTGRHS